MRNERFSLLKIAGLFLLAVMFSCENKPDLIGLELLPDEDALLVSFDSLEVIQGYTVYRDSLAGVSKTVYPFGSLEDPYFGITRADIVTQIQASSSQDTFGLNPDVDSVIMYLYYDSYSGTPTGPLQIRAYEYTEDLEYDTLYYSNMDITGKYREPEIGTAWISAADTVIRIRITDDEFINGILMAEDSVLSSTEYLQDLVKGFYLKSGDPGPGGIITYVDFNSYNNRLSFYYSNDESDSLEKSFPIGSLSLHFNLFRHDYSGYPIEAFIDNGKTDDSLLFVQSMAGVTPMIRLTGITEWLDSMPVAIIDAKLILHVADTLLTQQESRYFPSSLDLYLFDSIYHSGYDYLLEPGAAGGDYDEDANSYILNLKVQIQNILQGNVENLELSLKPASPDETVTRVVLYGWSQDPDKRIRLEITYLRL